jgi:hypothetical protein
MKDDGGGRHPAAKKMRLVTDDVYERLMNGNLPSKTLLRTSASSNNSNPNTVPVRSEDEILSDSKLGDDEKWKLIQQQLHRMLEIKSAEGKKPPLKVQIEKDDGDGDEKEDEPSGAPTAAAAATVSKDKIPMFLSQIPKNLRAKALVVIQFLKDRKNIRWDERGNVWIDGAEIDGAHIADLIKCSLRTSVREPLGWGEFCEFLASVKTPPSLIGNRSLKTFLTSSKSPKLLWSTPASSERGRKTKDDSEADVSSSTPAPSRKGRSRFAQNKKDTQYGEGARRRRCGRRGGGAARTKTKQKGKKTSTSKSRHRLRVCKKAKRIVRWKTFG